MYWISATPLSLRSTRCIWAIIYHRTDLDNAPHIGSRAIRPPPLPRGLVGALAISCSPATSHGTAPAAISLNLGWPRFCAEIRRFVEINTKGSNADKDEDTEKRQINQVRLAVELKQADPEPFALSHRSCGNVVAVPAAVHPTSSHVSWTGCGGCGHDLGRPWNVTNAESSIRSVPSCVPTRNTCSLSLKSSSTLVCAHFLGFSDNPRTPSSPQSSDQRHHQSRATAIQGFGYFTLTR